MSEVKMSDVFELPMVQGSIVLMSNDHRYVIEFDASDSNVGDQIESVAHAVNNHDRLQQENAELLEHLANLVTESIALAQFKNDTLRKGICSTDMDEPEWHDYQTIGEAGAYLENLLNKND
ncbi:putative coil containing protein [Vibrio phage 199E37-1]|nr:putative coil containing protein [Vibrio phage 199E37-1]